MLKRNSFLFLVLICFGLAFQGCVKDECTAEQTFVDVIPVWLTQEEMRTPVTVEEPRPLEKTGKIYYYNNYILINSPREGIHVIDNTVPENPNNIAFLNLVGNVDMSVRGDILYADSYYDLVTISFSDPLNATEIKRLENVYDPISVNQANGLILAYYKEELVTREVACNSRNNGPIFWDFLTASAGEVSNSSGDSNASAFLGVGGSMARFTINGEFLYTVDETTLRAFNLSNPECPVLSNEQDVGWGIETIFPYEDKLFLGSNNGMFIFDAADSGNPVLLSQFQHARACDPVYVKGDYAYVTLRSGSFCEGFNNQLDVIDISSLTNPVLEKTFPMENPHGLSISGNTLFLCEGEHGLKVFDIEDPLTLDDNLIDFLRGIDSFDAISLPNGLLMVIGKEGLYQYNYEDPSNLVEVSFIPVAG